MNSKFFSSTNPPRPNYTAQFDDVVTRLARVEAKLDETLSALDFVTSRLTTYVGRGAALTYLADGSPIYVNSEDFGSPANFITGGRYEEDNLAVLRSFVRCDTVFLDVGANLGFFSLQVALRAPFGQVHAFEPHPELVRLMRASAYLNGLMQLTGEGRFAIHEFGLSDRDEELVFSYPDDHLGGGGVGEGRGARSMKLSVRRLDALMDSDFVCDLIKMDVEGHEPHVFSGMLATLGRSRDVKVLFEKLEADVGFEPALEKTLHKLGFSLYGVAPHATLAPIATGGLSSFSGYVLAARDPDLAGSRNRFSIYPRQLSARLETLVACTKEELRATGEADAILFHGPYWILPRGVHRLTLKGEVEGPLRLAVAARFGHPAHTFDWDPAVGELVFACPRDLQHFEIIGRAGADKTTVRLERIDIERIG